MTTSTSYVRDEFSPERPAPGQTGGLILWLRTNLFATPSDALLTILGMVFLFWAVPPLYNFIIGHAVMPGGTVEDCRVEGAGACWAYIYARFNFFIYGFYPIDQYWRPNIVFVMLAALIIPLAIPAAPFKRLNAALFFVVFPVVTFYLLNGGVFGLREVPTEQWGGLMVTLIISLVGIICSIPIGILLALGRQSDLPIIKTLSVMFIELWRAVPLITVLFMASIMLPLFMPTGTTVDKLLRALVGVTLFSSAYMAEVVRGGLQALPRGQYEAGASLGLSYWKRTYFIILPQALKHVIPGIVNNWASPTQAVTGYVFAAFMFWIFCFAMSRYSLWMEHRLNTGHKR